MHCILALYSSAAAACDHRTLRKDVNEKLSVFSTIPVPFRRNSVQYVSTEINSGSVRLIKMGLVADLIYRITEGRTMKFYIYFALLFSDLVDNQYKISEDNNVLSF